MVGMEAQGLEKLCPRGTLGQIDLVTVCGWNDLRVPFEERIRGLLDIEWRERDVDSVRAKHGHIARATVVIDQAKVPQVLTVRGSTEAVDRYFDSISWRNPMPLSSMRDAEASGDSPWGELPKCLRDGHRFDSRRNSTERRKANRDIGHL
jgi:hypothetical protein